MALMMSSGAIVKMRTEVLKVTVSNLEAYLKILNK